MSPFRYTHAIVCRLPDSYKTGALGVSEPVDLAKVRSRCDFRVGRGTVRVTVCGKAAVWC